MPNTILELRRYRTADGRVPFSEWFASLDGPTTARVSAYKDRMQAGRWGDSRFVGEGVWELKIDFGPGYRIYYLRDGRAVVILLCGGDKGSQQSDIRQAHEFAADYRRRR
ncbi:MAG: type II toxin-antitoxin system RelE/ParE family toxin [Elusimicrobia bacterium]|nr:type II toxin-antitoxin system RelE/ParE family toxin [Elusimicrobiota bacterium]